MAMFTNKQTGESVPMDTNDARNSGQYWETDLIPEGVPWRYLKDDANGNPVAMTETEKSSIDAKFLSDAKIADKSILVANAKEYMHNAVVNTNVDVEVIAVQALLLALGSKVQLPYNPIVNTQLEARAQIVYNKITEIYPLIEQAQTMDELNAIDLTI